MVGSKIIDRVIEVITKGELVRATVTWKQAHFSVVISRWFQLPCRCAEGDGDATKGATPFTTHCLTVLNEFSLDNVQGQVRTTWRITIPPFGTINIHGNTDIQGNCMWIHMLAETGPPAACFCGSDCYIWGLHPGSSHVPNYLRNLHANHIIIPIKVVVGKVTAAHWVALMALPTEAIGEPTHDPWKDWVLEEQSLQGLEEWPEEEWDWVRKLLVRWELAHSNLDLGKMSGIKHLIKLTNQTPFKECYW